MPSTSTRSFHVLTVLSLVVAPVLVAAPLALAAPGGGANGGADKVRICHRTNALTNPYVSIEVARSSVDGTGGKGDHYLNHTGAVWTSSSTKAEGWGDIIPPIPGVHGGRNWTAEGEAIWSAGCRPTSVSDRDDDGIPDVTDPDSDNDTIPDAVDPDDDGDGVTDTTDPDESPTTDTDGDTIPDASDSDDDGDGVTDNRE